MADSYLFFKITEFDKLELCHHDIYTLAINITIYVSYLSQRLADKIIVTMIFLLLHFVLLPYPYLDNHKSICSSNIQQSTNKQTNYPNGQSLQ